MRTAAKPQRKWHAGPQPNSLIQRSKFWQRAIQKRDRRNRAVSGCFSAAASRKMRSLFRGEPRGQQVGQQKSDKR